MACRVWRPLALSTSTGNVLPAEDAVASAQQRARQVVTDDALRHLRRFDRSLQVDVDVDSAVPQQVDQVLDGDIAAGARSERTAAEAADRGVEPGDTSADGSVRAGQASPAGVVEVGAQRGVFDQRPD